VPEANAFAVLTRDAEWQTDSKRSDGVQPADVHSMMVWSQTTIAYQVYADKRPIYSHANDLLQNQTSQRESQRGSEANENLFRLDFCCFLNSTRRIFDLRSSCFWSARCGCRPAVLTLSPQL
jgi:hypothetical protein